MADEKQRQQIQYEKKLQCLCQQLQEYACQIDMSLNETIQWIQNERKTTQKLEQDIKSNLTNMNTNLQNALTKLQEEIDHTRCRHSTACRELDELKRQLSQRDDDIAMFESKFDNLRFEFKESEKTNQRILENLQNKIATCHEQLQKRESCLVMCKNDAKSHEVSMEEARTDFVCELQQKDNCMIHMKEDLRRVFDELKSKSESSSVLEKVSVDLRSRLHHTNAQLKDAENKIAALLEKIQQLECLSTRDKNQAMKDIEEFDKKLGQSCNELCNCQNENRKLKRCLQELDEKSVHLSSEINTVTRDIQNLKIESCGHQERAASLENDNKEICRLMQQKVKCIKELESALCVKDEELEQCRCCVEQLKETVRRLSSIVEDKEDNSDLEKALKLCKEKLKKTQDELEECRKKLEWAVHEMDSMATEIKRLNCELDEARRQLTEKNSLIGDLERTIEHAEQDMENRIRRVDEQLQKYEKEIKDKAHMISECDEKCCRYQKSMDDKEAELEQMDNQLCRVNCEINSLCLKIKELEDMRDTYQKKNNEQRTQNSEICQELKCTKEQIDVVSLECGETKRDLSCCQRELEKLRRESEELKLDLQEKDTCACRLMDEKSCLSNKVSSLQCRIENDTAELTQQMTDLRFRLESEIERLRTCQMKADENNACLTKKLSAGQRQLAQLEKCYYQKVDTFNRENQNLQTKIADKEDQLQAIKDAITLRDSEIMRLKLRLCAGDRCSNNLTPGADCQQICMSSGAAMPETAKCRKRTLSWGADMSCCRPTGEAQ